MIDYHALTSANVYLRKMHVGMLRKESAVRFSFQYNPDYIQKEALPISRVIPVRKAPFISEPGLHPFFPHWRG